MYHSQYISYCHLYAMYTTMIAQPIFSFSFTGSSFGNVFNKPILSVYFDNVEGESSRDNTLFSTHAVCFSSFVPIPRVAAPTLFNVNDLDAESKVQIPPGY